jgi:hypothetical protein
VSASTADTVLRRAATLGTPNARDRAELRWMDGVVGIAEGNGARVQAAVAALTADTLPLASYLRRSLAGLWLHPSDPTAGADSLLALSDETMKSGQFSIVAAALDRLVVARALRQRGAPGDVEHYLMWPDASVNSGRAVGVTAIAPLVLFERGVALDEAGQRSEAARHLRDFVNAYDRPPAAHVDMVADAKARLGRLETTDAPAAPNRVP